MRRFSYMAAGLALIGAILACNLPSNQQAPGAVMTSAALTVQAKLSPSAPTGGKAAATPTFTPSSGPAAAPPAAAAPGQAPAPIATATTNCDSAQFIKDVSYPDNTVVTAGDSFTKTWRLQNDGACSWTPSYVLVFISGDLMAGPSTQALSGNVNPGQTTDISVSLTAPASGGTYRGNWGLRNASGLIFAHFYVQIKVNSGGGGGSFAVIHVNFDTSGGCGSFTATAKITTNGPGDVTYHWVRSDGAIDTTTHAPVHFASAGTKSVSESWATTASGGKWIDIYIDTPNHQQFGRASFSCP